MYESIQFKLHVYDMFKEADLSLLVHLPYVLRVSVKIGLTCNEYMS